jgi:hypothetical protein
MVTPNKEVRFISKDELTVQIDRYVPLKEKLTAQSKAIQGLIQALREAKTKLPFKDHPAFPMFQERVEVLEKLLEKIDQLGENVNSSEVAEWDNIILQGFTEIVTELETARDGSQHENEDYFATLIDLVQDEKNEIEEGVETSVYSRRDVEGELADEEKKAREGMEKSTMDLVKDETREMVMKLFALGKETTESSKNIEDYLSELLFDYIPLDVAYEVTKRVLDEMEELFKEKSDALNIDKIEDEVKKEMNYDQLKAEEMKRYNADIDEIDRSQLKGVLPEKKALHVDKEGPLDAKVHAQVEERINTIKNQLAVEAGYPEGWLALKKKNDEFKSLAQRSLRQLQTSMNMVEKLRAALQKLPIAETMSEEKEAELVVKIVGMEDAKLSDSKKQFQKLGIKEPSAARLTKEQIGKNLGIDMKAIFDYERTATTKAEELFAKPLSKPSDKPASEIAPDMKKDEPEDAPEETRAPGNGEALPPVTPADDIEGTEEFDLDDEEKDEEADQEPMEDVGEDDEDEESEDDDKDDTGKKS